MNRALSLLLVALLATGCAMQPPAPRPTEPPPPPFLLVNPAGTEGASDMFGYSQAAVSGPWVIVAGQVGFDTEKFGFPEKFEDQVRIAFRNLEAVLRASGVELKDVMSMTTWQLDMDQFNTVVDVRNDVFGLHRPAWTPLGAKALALPSVQFTVSAIAYSPGAQERAAALRAKAEAEAQSPVSPATAPPAPQKETETMAPGEKERPNRNLRRPGY